MAQPVRSIRISGRIASNLDRISGETGEIFYDSTNKTLRIYTGNGGEHNIAATRLWTSGQITANNATLNSAIALKASLASPTFTGTLTAPTLVGSLTGDVYASNGTTKILENGTGANATFTGNVTGQVSDITNHGINALSDVDTATAAPTTGQSLVWNGSVWHPQTITGGGGAGGTDVSTASISDLADVDTTGKTDGQVLTWSASSTNWIPSSITAASLGLGNVTNESKTTMFASPTFTGIAALPAGSTIGGSAIANTGNVTFTSVASPASNTISTTAGNITIAKLTTFSAGISVTGSLGASINALTDVDTSTNAPTNGQVLKWNGTNWVPSADVTSGGGGTDAATFNGQGPIFYLNYNNLENTPNLASFATTAQLAGLAPLDGPAFTGAVSFSGASVTGISASAVGLGNVANESKSTLFTSPTITGHATIEGQTLAGATGTGNLVLATSPTLSGTITFEAGSTVSGLTKTSVGLGNVTNESKATMFSDPTFTGTVTGVSKSAVGLGSVENTALSTWAGSTNITSIGSLTTAVLTNNANGIGYSTGNGGTVPQTTNRTTGVTLNKLAGTITLFNATAAAGTFSFLVTNNTVTANDVILVNTKTSTNTANVYIPQVTQVNAGSFRISVYVPVAIGANDQPQINFFVLKGVVN